MASRPWSLAPSHEAMLNSNAACSSRTAAGTLHEGAANVNAVQAYEVKVLTAAVQELGQERANVQAQLASLASRTFH